MWYINTTLIHKHAVIIWNTTLSTPSLPAEAGKQIKH